MCRAAVLHVLAKEGDQLSHMCEESRKQKAERRQKRRERERERERERFHNPPSLTNNKGIVSIGLIHTFCIQAKTYNHTSTYYISSQHIS